MKPAGAIEIKLSQGAKPGLGGVLPGEKVTAEISKIRGVPRGETVISPSGHSAFSLQVRVQTFLPLTARVQLPPSNRQSSLVLHAPPMQPSRAAIATARCTACR